MDEVTYRMRLAAGEFFEAGQRCGSSAGRGWLSKPEVVNYAFAAELGLKALQRLHNGGAVKGHDLFKLYQNLPSDVARVVRGAANQEIFEDRLKEIAGTFEQWRYAYEKELLVVSITALKGLVVSVLAAFDQSVV